MQRLCRAGKLIVNANVRTYFINWLVQIIVCSLVLLSVSCSKSDGPAGPTNHPPETPVLGGLAETPVNGATDVPLVTTLNWSATDPDDDQLTYVVCLGPVPSPSPVAEDYADTVFVSDSLDYSTTYHWNVTARDLDGDSAVSATWSFTTIPEPPEVIYKPDPPDLPPIAIEDDTVLILARGIYGNLGHHLEHQFDWGNGELSDWGSSVRYHIWDTGAIYPLKVRARCGTHTDVVSEWSDIAPLRVRDWFPEVVTFISISGPTYGYVGEELTFKAQAKCNHGHNVEYEWTFPETQYGYEFPSPGTVTHVFERATTWLYWVQARCQRHPDVLSEDVGCGPVYVSD